MPAGIRASQLRERGKRAVEVVDCSRSALALLFADILAVLVLQAGGLEYVVAAPADRARRRLCLASRSRLRSQQCRSMPRRTAHQRRTAPLAVSRAAGPSRRRPDRVRAFKPQARSRSVMSSPATCASRRRPAAQGLTGLGTVLDRAHGGRIRANRRPSTSPTTRSRSSRSSTGRCWRTRSRCPMRSIAKIDAYMKEGGLIIFDTRDYGQGGANQLPVRRQRRQRRCSACSASSTCRASSPCPRRTS